MVLQFVPDPVRDERLNVGLILADPSTGTVELRRAAKLARIHRIDPHADLPGLSEYLDGLAEQVASLSWTGRDAFEGLVDLEEHFQLTEARAALISPDAVNDLFERLVGAETRRGTPSAPTRPQIRKWVRGEFKRRGLFTAVTENASVAGEKDAYVFDFAHQSKASLWALEVLVVRPDSLETTLDGARALLFKREDIERAAPTRRVELDAVVSSPPGSSLDEKVVRVVEAAGCIATRPEDAPGRLEAILKVR
jgi:hypothetical protein